MQSPDQLQKARLLVRAFSKIYVDDRVVWLDVKKSREELRPARIVHRMTEMIQEFESAEQNPLKVEKKLNGKYVEVGDHKRVGQVRKGSWVWLPFALERYETDQLEFAKTYAEEE